MTLDPRWKFPQGKSPEHLYDALYQLIRELRKGNEEGTWTPTLTFDTPGDLDVVYSTRLGVYTKIGRMVFMTCEVIATPTWLTAADDLLITGLPHAAAASPNLTHRGTMRWGGINKANHTQVGPSLDAGSSTVAFTACGMGQAGANVLAADMTSAAIVRLSFQLTYFV